MPGIYGFIQKRSRDRQANRALLEQMRQVLEHTPGYESQTFANDWLGLGTTELPVAGQERFLAADERPQAAAFSGYLYGWRDGTSIRPLASPKLATQLIDYFISDQECLPDRIDGSYNLFVASLPSQTCRLFNDRFGHRQLYYLDSPEIFVFATELKAILVHAQARREIDQQAAFDYFNYGYPLGDRTFFTDIKLLRGGHSITIDHGTVTIKPYWQYAYPEPSTASIPDLIDELDAIYRDHLARLIGENKSLVLPLSGGLDSRFIASHVKALGKTPRLFAHGAKGCNEEKIARTVANELGFADQYRFVEVNPRWLLQYVERFVFLTEGMIHTGPAMLLGTTAEYDMPRERSVFLNGIFGGPTNFGSGYYRAFDLPEPPDRAAKLHSIKLSLFGYTLSEQFYETFAGDLRQDLKDSYLRSIDEEFDRCESVSPHFYHQKDTFFITNRLARFMNQVDCNRYGWHDHFALSSRALVDFYVKLPPQLNMGRRFFMEYFKAKFPAMAAIKYQATGVNLYQQPSAWSKRWKRYKGRMRYYTERLSRGRINLADPDQYYRYDQWYRQDADIRAFYENLLLDNRTFDRGYFDRAGTERLLKRQRLGGNGFFDISSLAGFELFCRTFVDR